MASQDNAAGPTEDADKTALPFAVAHFWPSFASMFLLHLIPGFVGLWIILRIWGDYTLITSDNGETTRQLLRETVILIKENKLTLFSDIFSLILLPTAAYYSIAAPKDNRRSDGGVLLFYLVLIFLLIFLGVFGLTYIFGSYINQINPGTGDTFDAAIFLRDIFEGYVKNLALMFFTVVGVNAARK
jgi:hypothetical protein